MVKVVEASREPCRGALPPHSRIRGTGYREAAPCSSRKYRASQATQKARYPLPISGRRVTDPPRPKLSKSGDFTSTRDFRRSQRCHTERNVTDYARTDFVGRQLVTMQSGNPHEESRLERVTIIPVLPQLVQLVQVIGADRTSSFRASLPVSKICEAVARVRETEVLPAWLSQHLQVVGSRPRVNGEWRSSGVAVLYQTTVSHFGFRHKLELSHLEP